MEIILAEKGTNDRKIDIDDIAVPDLWYIATCNGSIDKKGKSPGVYIDAVEQRKIMECWHLCHDLLGALRIMAETLKVVHTK